MKLGGPVLDDLPVATDWLIMGIATIRQNSKSVSRPRVAKCLLTPVAAPRVTRKVLKLNQNETLVAILIAIMY